MRTIEYTDGSTAQITEQQYQELEAWNKFYDTPEGKEFERVELERIHNSNKLPEVYSASAPERLS